MEKQKSLLSLEHSHLVILFYYYALLIVAGAISSIAVFIPGKLSIFDYFGLSLIGSSSIACAGSAIFYFRKLYKLILQENLKLEESPSHPKVIATLAYFIARPLFSVVFAIIVVIGIKSGLALSSAKSTGVDYGFVQLTMFFSFFAGFLSGRFIRKLENWGDTVLNRLTSEPNDLVE